MAAALFPSLRPAVLVVLALRALLAPRGSAARWAFAAGLPAAVILTWGAAVGSQIQADTSDCSNPLSPTALLRVAEAVAVLGLVGLLARWLGTSVRSLGLRRPTSSEVVLASLAIATIPIASVSIGAILAEPFFGPIRLDLGQPLAIVPALSLALANGGMEELAYRGALMSWGTRALGPAASLVGQAVVFGAAHAGSDYVASALPVVITIAGGGLLAGLIAHRTGSLWLPIVVHVCFDVPLYYVAACRA